MSIGASAMTAQRVRMNIISTNMANAQTTKTDEGGPYKRQDPVFEAVNAGKVDSFEDLLDPNYGTELKKVQVSSIHQDPNPPKRVFDPNHPDAGEDGYVEMPNITIMTEMVNMIAATRAYEANATVVNEAKNVALKALEIGR